MAVLVMAQGMIGSMKRSRSAATTLIAALVLAQVPSARDGLGIALVMAGVAVHRPAQA